MSKKRVTLSLREEQVEQLEDMAEDDDPHYDSKSKAARYLFDQVGDLEDEVSELEQTVERLQNEKQVLIEKHQETQQLVKYKEEEQFIDEAGLSQRLKWLLFGKDP